MTHYFTGLTEEEAIQKGKDFGSVEFNGDENCNDFDGDCMWDGESRRCFCGNRRVYWDTNEQSDGTWEAHGEAW